jgi:hypothetical protein
MALSFDQYRYFSAAWLRDQAQREQAGLNQVTAAKREPTSAPARLATVTRLVPRPREQDAKKPD